MLPPTTAFQIERKYEAIDDPADVQREPDGTWVIKAGARVRVRVTMSNPARRYHVALVDPLPAGLEPLNPELATTERLPEESAKRESIAAAAVSMITTGTGAAPGMNIKTFVTNASKLLRRCCGKACMSTPTLRVQPRQDCCSATFPKAEEMYEPETFGRGQSDKVRVK